MRLKMDEKVEYLLNRVEKTMCILMYICEKYGQNGLKMVGYT
jgi:hypothetical protein